MPDKQKSAQKSRKAKQSKGSARGAKPVRLTDIQKVLLGGGMLRQRPVLGSRTDKKGGRK